VTPTNRHQRAWTLPCAGGPQGAGEELSRRTLTTQPDHNRIRRGPIPADAPVDTFPGERLFPTVRAYFANRGSAVTKTAELRSESALV